MGGALRSAGMAGPLGRVENEGVVSSFGRQDIVAAFRRWASSQGDSSAAALVLETLAQRERERTGAWQGEQSPTGIDQAAGRALARLRSVSEAWNVLDEEYDNIVSRNHVALSRRGCGEPRTNS